MKTVSGTKKIMRLLCAVLFTLIFGLIFVALNHFFQLVWYNWGTYDSQRGIYEEPENTIETLFLGASIMSNGISPMELYENYGICAYNMGLVQAPVSTSYRWLEEIYKRQGESLKTVVLEVSILRKEPEESHYRRSLDFMRFSDTKIKAIQDFTDGSLQETISYLVPLFSYHDRWEELSEVDFTKFSYETKDYLRGYNFYTVQTYFTENSYSEITVPNYYPNFDVGEAELVEVSLEYLDKIVDFCSEHELKLVLVKTPGQTLGVKTHNAVQSVADSYGIDFFDFNYEPYIDEIGFNKATDCADGSHLNYFGASKLTEWFGNYLVSECFATDVRGVAGYEFLDKQLEEYHDKVTFVTELKAETDPSAYITKAASLSDCTVFIAVKNDAELFLTDEQKEAFLNAGLAKLSEIEHRDSYLAVIDSGTVKESKSGEKKLTSKGILDDGTIYKVVSGGYNHGNTVSILLDGEEYAAGSRGLNVVVYDNASGEVVDIAIFDTGAASARDVTDDYETSLSDALKEVNDYNELPDDLKKLYLYNMRCEDARNLGLLKQLSGEGGLLTYLDGVIYNENYIVSVKVSGDAAEGLTDEARGILAKIGLYELSAIQNGDSYLGIISGGEVLLDQAGYGEYSSDEQGVDIIVWNKVTEEEAASVNFNTKEIPVSISDSSGEEVYGE